MMRLSKICAISSAFSLAPSQPRLCFSISDSWFSWCLQKDAFARKIVNVVFQNTLSGAQSRQSAKLFLQSSELRLLHSLTHRRLK